MSRWEFRHFFSALGFDENPFAHTNADEEDRLSTYFIAPPYFPSVFGDPAHSKSFVVFAPRGGGKSAQRRMMEDRCNAENVLAITYDRFDFSGAKRPSDVSLYHHLERIIRFSLVGLLVTLHADPSPREHLSKHDRQVLVKLAGEYLKGINRADLKKATDSLKSLKDKVKDFWNEWLPVMGPGLEAALQKLLRVDVERLGEFQEAESVEGSYRKYQLELIVDLAQKLGFKAIYVLIDRVDESELTGNDAIASFKLVESMLRDLELLELRGVGFKFFLWDQLEPEYLKIARTDRVMQETLHWDDDMLRAMWKKRLQAYSGGRISGLGEISDFDGSYPLDDLVLIFASHSPRDMIRIGWHIISEQQEMDLRSGRIRSEAVYRGIEKFCSVRAKEIVTARTLNQLRKFQQVDFTIPYLASVVFRERTNSTRSRIHNWRREGIIVDLDERVDNPNPDQDRPVKLFAISDIRVAKVMNSSTAVPDFLRLKYKQCPACGAIVLRDWGEPDSLSRCHLCQYDVISEERDSWATWRRRELAVQTRRRRREETLDWQQLSFENLQAEGQEGSGE